MLDWDFGASVRSQAAPNPARPCEACGCLWRCPGGLRVSGLHGGPDLALPVELEIAIPREPETLELKWNLNEVNCDFAN
jgi:hypothetical protein